MDSGATAAINQFTKYLTECQPHMAGIMVETEDQKLSLFQM